MTLDDILDTILLESGMDTEDAYAASTDPAVLRLVKLANRAIANLSQYPWQALRKTHTFTLSTATTYSLPADYRRFIADTMFSDAHPFPADFPASEGEWGYLQSSAGGGTSRLKVRILGNLLHVYEPTEGDSVRVEYLSNTPVYSTSAVRKEKFTADTDYPVLDSDLLTQDIMWRYKKMMGLEWQPDLAEFRNLEKTLRGYDGGLQTIRPHEYTADSPYYELWRPSSEAV